MLSAILLMTAIGVYPTPHTVKELPGKFGTADYIVYNVQDGNLAPEEYALTLTNGVAEIRSNGDVGAFYARQTLDQLAPRLAELNNLEIKDKPDIPLRGVVEGYYGRPWGTEGRISTLEFMGRHKMNLFLYGPKDDPYHHEKWREEYPEKEARDFQRLLDVARKNKIRFYWAIHLGGSFRKGGEAEQEDTAALLKKLDAMYGLGVRAFAAFFDDFGDADAEFHAKICNLMSDYLAKKGDVLPLIMCPNVYWGRGEHVYTKVLGEKLDPKTMIIWTGHRVCADILQADVKAVAKSYRRSPFVWWNWPVNDYCRSKVLMGRTYGLERAKFSGFVTNPMENCEANKVALFGVSDWCWNGKAFDSQKNWEAAFEHIYPDREVARAMKIFATHNSDQAPNSQLYRREESEGEWNFAEIAEAMDVLKRKLPMEEPQLWWELEGWITDLECLAKMGLKLQELEQTEGELARKHILKDVWQLKEIQLENANRHVEKFRAATFANDAKQVKAPETGTLKVRPEVERLMK